jgi:Flp pilus assembly CpaF family ATPase
VANNTMDEHMAALLWAIAEEKRSFVSAAGPQNAGKSTVLFAMLDHVPVGTPIHEMNGEVDEMDEYAKSPDGGYLEVGEISDHRPVRYIWGEPVRVLFTTLNTGFSLATTMHADGVDDVFRQICVENEVSDADASTIQFVVHILRFGEDMESYWRRIDSVHEITGVKNGVQIASELFSWDEETDSFIASNPVSVLSASSALLAERAESIRELAAKVRDAAK